MAETPITPPAKPESFPDPEKHNREVAQTLQNQDTVGKPATQADLSATGDALDTLAKNVIEKKEDASAPEPTPEEKVAADKKAAEDAAASAKAEETAKKAAEEKTALEAKSNEYFKDTPGLPPGASPRSTEAFSSIKIKATQEISAREAEIEKLKAEKVELEKRLENPIPPELKKEVESLREFRSKLDVEADPKFKAFDQNVSAAQEFIYAQLKKSPVVTDDIIAEIKKHGGPEQVNMTTLFDKMKDPTLQRIVEAKVADIEMLKYQKTQAVTAAKTNIEKYVADREKQYQEATTAHNTATQNRLNPLINSLEWMKPKTVSEKDDAASVEAHNTFVETTKKQIADAMTDDSPEMRAILLVGMAQLFNIQRIHAATNAELASLKKEHASLTEKWEKVKSSSTSRLRESGASAAPGAIRQDGNKAQFSTDTTGSLDSIAKQVMEQKQAKGL